MIPGKRRAADSLREGDAERGRFGFHGKPAALVVSVFVVSRVLFFLAGVRFEATPLNSYWQYLDPQWLREDLVRSLFYLHSQPPLFNCFLGLVLKTFPGHESGAFAVSYMALGLVLGISLYLLMIRLGVSRWLGAVLSILFLISPSCILYENWLFYTCPVTVLLCVSALFFHRFLSTRSVANGIVFFTLLAAVVLTRSIFHLFWFLLFGVILVLSQPRHWKKVVVAGCVPLALLMFVYAKNLYLFGSFSSSTWLGMNFAKITTVRVPKELRWEWVSTGTLSSLALHHPFAGPGSRSYRGYFSQRPRIGVSVLDDELKSTGHANYNNIAYVRISKQYFRDAMTVLALDPVRYLGGVAKACEIYLRPGSHSELLRENRRRLRDFERAYHIVFHGQVSDERGIPLQRGSIAEYYVHARGSAGWFTSKAWFLIVGCPLLTLFGFVLGMRVLRTRADAPFALTMLFLAANIAYVTVVSNAVEIGENNRYRFIVDPYLLVIAGVCLERGLGALRRRRSDMSKVCGDEPGYGG